MIKDGQVRIVNIKNQDTVTKALDMVPDILDRFKPARRAEDAVIVETVKSQESEKPAED